METDKQRNEERGAEKLMDAHLKALGLLRKKIAKDGSCLFRAVAEQVLHCQSRHTEVRSRCVDFLKQNRESYEAFIEGDFEDYLYKLQDPQQWVGEVEINALAVMYKRDFLIYQEPGKPAVAITDNNFKEKVQLCFLNGNHYDSVYPVSHFRSAALCQSILYELLYDGVFNVDKSSLGVCQRIARANDALSDDNMPACASSDESDLDANETRWTENGTSTTRQNNQSHRGRGRGSRLSERVRRSLNPTLYRNIEYDVWQKTKRAQHKLDYSIAAGMQFTAGDRCQVCVDGRNHNATIKEVTPNNGPVTVFIADLGKRQVPLWMLRPTTANSENSWSTVVNRDKKVSNGHGEWEERGKGRGRGKHAAASSSVSQATAASSTGRVQKQHSWPQQATVEEPGGGKASRKSVSSGESTFGLTEEQRLAKEEEERNVALVEIQLRDEHSFPALSAQPGIQSDGGKKKGGEKRRSQRNKTKSPVEDVRAASPPAGDRPKSSTPPLFTAAPPSDPPSAAAKPPPANESNPARSGSLKAATSSSYASAAGAAPASPPPSVTKPSPPLFSFITPVLPSASSSSSVAPKPSSSPPPSSSLPAPTFIAPIAPSPTAAAAQGFLPRSSPSPPSISSSLLRQAPPASASNSLPNPGAPPTEKIQPQVPQTETSSARGENQTENQPPLHEPPPEVTSASQIQPPVLHTAPPQVQSHPLTSQASGPVSSSAPPQPPHPSQLPHPSLSLSASSTPPFLQSQTEAAPPPPPHPSLQPLPLLPPPPPQSIPGAVPVQQLSQLFQDPLYPGFPQSEKGDVAPVPPFSSSKSGDDLPRDVNVLRFFFNLGVKAYTMPMYLPYMYLFPLQQAHAVQPKLPSPAPSPSPTPHYPPSNPTTPTPHYPPSNPPNMHQETYQPPQFPPTSASLPPQFDHQARLPEPPHPSDPSFMQAGYPVTQPPPRMPLAWQQHQMPPPRNASFPVGYPTPSRPYPPVPPPSSQGYHLTQGPGHHMYPPYPPSSLGYQPPSGPEELQVSQAVMEQRQPAGRDSMSGQGPGRVPALLESPANNNRTLAPGVALKKDQGDSLTREVLLVDPPLNNMPILIQNPVAKDVSMATMKPSSNPGSQSPYDRNSKMTVDNNPPHHILRGPRQPLNPAGAYMGLDHGQVGYLPGVAMPEGLSVGCSTEEDWDEPTGFKPATSNHRGPGKYRGGRGARGRGHDAGRGQQRRRHGGEMGGFMQYNPSYKGRGR